MPKILAVDDSIAEHFINRIVLRQLGDDVEVICAHDGSEALTVLEQSSTLPDLILLDLNMPGLTGLEFLEEWAKKRGNSLPIVVMLTSSDDPRDRKLAVSYECVKHYFIKPLTNEYLVILGELLHAYK